MFRLIAFVLTMFCASALLPTTPCRRLLRSSSAPISDQSTCLHAVSDEISDLNLEQMFEVFDAADKKVKDTEVKSSRPAFDPRKEIGSSAPLGFFDPLGFTKGIDEYTFKKYQESELKHGRIAMLAAVGFLFGESFHPLFNGNVVGPAIFQFQLADALFPNFWIPVMVLVGATEGRTIAIGWDRPEETFKSVTGVAGLRASYEAGNIGFDPLRLRPANPKAYSDFKTKELNNGRLAMLAVAGMVAQELVSNQAIFQF